MSMWRAASATSTRSGGTPKRSRRCGFGHASWRMWRRPTRKCPCSVETMPSPVLLAPTCQPPTLSPGRRTRDLARGRCGRRNLRGQSEHQHAHRGYRPRSQSAPVVSALHPVRSLLHQRSCGAGSGGRLQGICLTVDLPTGGPRNRQQKAKFKLPSNLSTPYMYDRNKGLRGDIAGDRPTETWKDVEWLRSFTKVPLLLKGVMTADSARRGVAVGAAGIIWSPIMEGGTFNRCQQPSMPSLRLSAPSTVRYRSLWMAVSGGVPM